jgi:hypothetical protein
MVFPNAEKHVTFAASFNSNIYTMKQAIQFLKFKNNDYSKFYSIQCTSINFKIMCCC